MNMNIFKAGAVAVAVSAMSLFATDADAATADGFAATSVTTGGNDHTVWLPGLIGGVDAYWQFEGGAGSFVTRDDKASATLDGRIINNKDSMLQLDVAVEFNRLDPDQPGGGGTKNGGLDSSLSAAEKQAIKDTWSFYDMTSATLTGVAGTLLDGLTLTLTSYPLAPKDIPFQLGESANDKNQGYGGAGWFTWVATTTSDYAGPAVRSTGDTGAGRHGDFNLNLTAVPLPAAGWMLIAAFGGLGVMRARKKAA
ncbi:VPLPA-CTERM sorting domain-containing protein [uncultured Roseobacter sp.]|uniref:VPLPA-CTERM sorting domain-containing protein n=1 Tax=uncultured Roseobacter sp. TaxID=114847 RepID=UPI002634DFB5|nr:VPLPA-CTERM sorting domain-containing protein [uncultured Roseobacter sp.]